MSCSVSPEASSVPRTRPPILSLSFFSSVIDESGLSHTQGNTPPLSRASSHSHYLLLSAWLVRGVAARFLASRPTDLLLRELSVDWLEFSVGVT